MADDFSIDFSPLGKLYQTYQQGQQQRQTQDWLQQQGLPQNLNLAQLAMQQQEHQRAQANTDRSFGLQERQFGLQEQQAKEAARGYDYRETERNGEKVLLRTHKQTGVTEVVPISGVTTPDPNSSIPQPPPGSDTKEWRKLHTEALVKAQQSLPGIEAQVGQTLKSIDDIRKDPYKAWGTGLTSPLSRIPGTPLYDFGQRVEQLKGKTFLDAYNTLKGGGAITEAEGAKATAAQARLSTAQTQAAFDEALKDLEDVVRSGLDRARQMAKPGGVAGATSQQPKAADAWKNKDTITAARADREGTLAQARQAIQANPANRDAVIQRLQAVGIDPRFLGGFAQE